MNTPAANAALEALVEALAGPVPESCRGFWGRCLWGERPEVAVFLDRGQEVIECWLELGTEQEFARRFAAYREALAPWASATVIGSFDDDGQLGFAVDHEYDLDHSLDRERWRADWEARYLGNRSLVHQVDLNAGVPVVTGVLAGELDDATKRVEALNRALHESVLKGYSRWACDLPRGEICFEFPDGRRAVAPVQVVGSINTRDGTWLWSWGNASVPVELRRHAETVRGFGARNRHRLLTTKKFPCDEALAWRLTALAGKLGGAQGIYRAPSGPVVMFLTMGPMSLS